MLDVLNRFANSGNIHHTIHIMKYVFPKQFSLHNVFTSNVDKQETVQPFKDYTLREKEIAQRLQDARRPILERQQSEVTMIRPHLPKRLRGTVVDLIGKMQRLHSRCSYRMMVEHYCPLPVRVFPHLLINKLTTFSGGCVLVPNSSHPITLVVKDPRS